MATLVEEKSVEAPVAATRANATIEALKASVPDVDPVLTPVGQNGPMSRLIRFAESAFEMLNPATPGKAEMRNCEAKWAAISESQKRA